MAKRKSVSRKTAKKSKTTKPRSKKIVRETLVTVGPARGRPMLNWVGKHALRQVTAFPAQHIETFAPIGPEQENWNDWSKSYPQGGLLFHGDNKEVLAHLLANGFRGKVKLIYIDPPFNTGVDYVRRVTLRGLKMEKLDGEGYSFTEQVQYSNSWHVDAYLEFLYERLQLGRELLGEEGILIVRSDIHFGYLVRLLLDEVMGQDHFENELVVNRIKKNVTNKGKRTIPNAVDYLYAYFKGEKSEYIDILKRLSSVRPGYWHNIDSPGVPGPRSLLLGGKTYYPSPGNHLKFPQDQADRMFSFKKIRENPNSGVLEYWVEDKEEIEVDSNWTDIPGYSFLTGYPTENSEPLLERIVRAASLPGDIVLDYFIGSGTTAAVAQRNGRRWIGCDINKGAIQTTSKRLQGIILEQIEEEKKEARQEKLDFKKDEGKESAKPAQHSFSVYRVNDYDLQIQHNEAVNLACELIGVQRTHNDAFFDGIQGKRLVKIIPFNHPLSPLDLEEIKNQLKSRPEENRDILVVSLGKELASDAWLEEWNLLRRKGDVPNKIEVIELRTDPKYGKFIEHKPAKARVKFGRKGDKIIVEIEDFISPTIIERLSQQNGVVQPQIKDWRSMVDCVMIDPAYDGKVFNVAISDVPEKKDDFVQGKYELPAPSKETMVAVKIIDMLGEEVVEVKEV